MPAELSVAGASETGQRLLEGLEPDLKPRARPLRPWLVLRHEASKAATPRGSGAPSASPAALGLAALWSQEEAEVDALLASSPIPPARSKLPVLTEDLLSRYLGPSRPMAGLRALDLHNCGLRKIEGLSSLMGSLRVLGLTFNEITKIEGVRPRCG